MARELELAEAAGVAECVAAMEVQTRTEPMGSGWLVDDGRDNGMSQAYGLGFDGAVTDEEIEQVTAFFRSGQRLPRVGVCPYADPSLFKVLRRQGYGLERFRNVLVREIAPDAPIRDHNKGVEVREVPKEDAQAVMAVSRVIAGGFGEGKIPPDEQLWGMRGLILQPSARTFEAWVDGERVGGGVMAFAGNRIALFAASTMPDARRRGVQTALIKARLEAGRQMGARWATIQAEPGVATRRNSQRLGFWLAYTNATCVLPAAE